MNRSERRAMSRQKKTGMTYADQLSVKQALRDTVHDKTVEELVRKRSTEMCSRFQWLCVVSIADAYGFGPKRMESFFRSLDTNTKELDAMIAENGEEYGFEKLRRKAEVVCGVKMTLEGM